MIFAAFFLIATLNSAPGQTVDEAGDAANRQALEAVIRSTTAEWSEAFAERGSVYRPPRAVFLRPPPGHPARGAGYSRSVGLIIDLGDVDAVITHFPADGRSLVALMIAHEVGHHVQTVLGEDPEVNGASRERQADCLAGWWITRAGHRDAAAGVSATWPVIDLSKRLPETLALLDVLQSGRADGGEANLDTHGSVEDRVAAFREGMAAAQPWTCLWGNNP